MDEYRVKVTVRNNLLLTAMEVAGYTNLQSFADACGISLGMVRQLTTLEKAPISQSSGQFSAAAQAVMECLGAAPCDLWTDAQLVNSLKKSSTTRTMGEEDIRFLLEGHADAMTLPSPEDEYIAKQSDNAVAKMLQNLTPREMKVLTRRLDEDTLAEIGKDEGVTRDRIRQIEAKAMRKLRNPRLSAPFFADIGRKA